MLSQGREFLLRVSYLEIYNEIINDLLDSNNHNLRIREDKTTGIFVEGLKEELVVSAEQVMAILSMGEASRKYGATSFNETSSRSHTIFRMVIESRDRTDTSKGAAVWRSVLSLIDLAGSEKVGRSTSTGQRAKEGLSINKSLLTLGNVINKLSDPRSAKGHIPYRDSKLTRILQPSLSGNARVCLICTAALPAPNACVSSPIVPGVCVLLLLTHFLLLPLHAGTRRTPPSSSRRAQRRCKWTQRRTRCGTSRPC